MKIKWMLLSQSIYCSEGVANWIPHEDKVHVIIPSNLSFRGGGKCLSLMEAKVDVITPTNILFIECGEFDPAS